MDYLQRAIQTDVITVVGDDWWFPMIMNQPVSGLSFEAYIIINGVENYIPVEAVGVVACVHLPGATSDSFGSGNYGWQVATVDSLGYRTTWYKGAFNIYPKQPI